jgi:hypothetical protein
MICQSYDPSRERVAEHDQAALASSDRKEVMMHPMEFHHRHEEVEVLAVEWEEAVAAGMPSLPMRHPSSLTTLHYCCRDYS